MQTSWRWPWLEPGADAAELDELAVGVGANRIEGKVQRVGGGLVRCLGAAHVIEPWA